MKRRTSSSITELPAPPRRKRGLSEEERALWESVAKQVKPLRKRHRVKPPAESERGVLRRQVPQWLGLPEFRSLVVGFEEAHIGHGGEGALYVRVRRARP